MSRSVRPGSARMRIGALLMLSACFIFSAFLRVGEVVAALPAGVDDGFGNPIAENPGADPEASASEEQGEVRAPDVLIAELERQRQALSRREASLTEREQTLKTLEQKLQDRLAEIRSARERLAETAALVDDAAGDDVRRLADMYQKMKPKQAGLIFNEMAPSFAAGFIAEMRPDTAALILANMDADKAYAVSLLLAGRNVDAEESASGR